CACREVELEDQHSSVGGDTSLTPFANHRRNNLLTVDKLTLKKLPFFGVQLVQRWGVRLTNLLNMLAQGKQPCTGRLNARNVRTGNGELCTAGTDCIEVPSVG